MKTKAPYLLIALLLFGALIVASPRTAEAHGAAWGLLFANVDLGWEEMLIAGNQYEKYNHGFSATLSAGFNLVCLFGLQIEQDLGFINVQQLGDHSRGEALFKGGTFLTWPIFSPPLSAASREYPNITAHLKLGFGALYMTTPSGSEKSMQTWFAFRPTLAIMFGDHEAMYDGDDDGGLAGGIEFDYTLAYAESNVFDHRNLTHFIGVKVKIMMTF